MTAFNQVYPVRWKGRSPDVKDSEEIEGENLVTNGDGTYRISTMSAMDTLITGCGRRVNLDSLKWQCSHCGAWVSVDSNTCFQCNGRLKRYGSH